MWTVEVPLRLQEVRRRDVVVQLDDLLVALEGRRDCVDPSALEKVEVRQLLVRREPPREVVQLRRVVAPKRARPVRLLRHLAR